MKYILLYCGTFSINFFAAAKSHEIGWGGVLNVSNLTGLFRKTINKRHFRGSRTKLNRTAGETHVSRVAGRRNAENKDPTLMKYLEDILHFWQLAIRFIIVYILKRSQNSYPFLMTITRWFCPI